MARLLIVDDGKNIRKHLATYFERRGHEVRTSGSAAEALSLVSIETGFDLVITDYRMAEMNGLELLHELRTRDANIAVILMTAYATVPSAVASIKAGAFDYLTKPFSLEQISHVVDRALEVQRLRSENRALRDRVENRPFLDSLNPAMKRLLRGAHQLSATAVPLLLVGESGTGKEVLARQIHRWSPRHDQPFIAADCATLPEDLLEAELFGAVRNDPAGKPRDTPGRLEAANGGTVFLKHIDFLNPASQRRLLLFIKSSIVERTGGGSNIPIDSRLMVDSTVDLSVEVAQGRFREDLLHQINAATIRIPPLRERSEDILPLAEYFLSSASFHNGNRRRRLALSAEALAKLTRYHWPGNVRELRNVMERASILTPKGLVTPDHLPDLLFDAPSSDEEPHALAPAMNDLERDHIVRVLATSESLEAAAEKLGINAATLWRKRKRYGLA